MSGFLGTVIYDKNEEKIKTAELDTTTVQVLVVNMVELRKWTVHNPHCHPSPPPIPSAQPHLHQPGRENLQAAGARPQDARQDLRLPPEADVLHARYDPRSLPLS